MLEASSNIVGSQQSFFATLLSQSGGSGDLDQTRKIHSRIVDSGYSKDKFLLNLIIQAYGKCGSVGDAHRVFSAIDHPNLFSWNIMIQAYARNGHLDEACNLFDRSHSPDPVAWNEMITAYANLGEMEEVKRLFDRVPEKSEITWTVMITAYARNGHLNEARTVFDAMPIEKKTIVSWTAMLQGYTQNSRIDQAFDFFQTFPAHNVVSITAMVSALASHGRGDEAEMLPTPSSSASIKVTYTTLLSCCDDLGDGEEIHACVVRDGIEWDVAMSTALVRCYGRCGNPEKAVAVFENFSGNKDVGLWTAMILCFDQNQKITEAIPGDGTAWFSSKQLYIGCSSPGIVELFKVWV
ncbi:pentatricopeptide repeat-containing protein At1g09410, mitochondrial [Selaginella moellendorffii]|uniref:pentatricopeptide repeat-containing protein At1g09410, mitochondrial n=1 Tax=Selaginella moellendorffii TaxID=88036 RepID=UPI000D1C8DE4|nr:pentatricopeptide repeat-containing protein At1g09410, mitochondrial [Selaginella moellendorffii]|eukprot:XP_024545664.1 pentatricopeptide repeat-containing protein At1g09410, mitochondrial [Selaginella moellendorffii]